MKKSFPWPAVIIAGAIVAVIGLVFYAKSLPGQYDNLAKCLTDKGVKFYGAFWCSHCQNQKAAFGRSAKLLPYIECSTSDGKSQLPICNDAKIAGYPTWIFPDGSREERELTPQELADTTGCPSN